MNPLNATGGTSALLPPPADKIFNIVPLFAAHYGGAQRLAAGFMELWEGRRSVGEVGGAVSLPCFGLLRWRDGGERKNEEKTARRGEPRRGERREWRSS